MEKSDICEIIVVRHGETVANKQGVLQGQSNTPLNEVGVMQAHAAAERLKRYSFDAAYTSDLERASDTAEIICKFHQELNLIKTSELREWNLGDLQGKSYGEVMEKYPEIMNAFRKLGNVPPIPGGENLEDFQLRISSFLDKIASENAGKKVLLVSHGGAMQRMLIHTMGMISLRNIFPMCANAGMSVFKCRGGEWQMVTWNDTAHLENIQMHDTLAL